MLSLDTEKFGEQMPLPDQFVWICQKEIFLMYIIIWDYPRGIVTARWPSFQDGCKAKCIT